jgi:dTMP kinase
MLELYQLPNMAEVGTKPCMDTWTNLAGKFIVIDGPDGAGKSTQLTMLAAFLRERGLDVVQTRDPGGTAIGDRIRAILLDNAHSEMAVTCETMLYMASRAQLVAEVIRPALSRGACVLCDRFVSSTIAYQGAGGADIEAIRRVADVAVGGIWPDLTVILDLGHDEGLRRAGARVPCPSPGGHVSPALDRMESKGDRFHQRVREMFLAQAKDQPDKFAVIDAAGTAEQVQERLREKISDWVCSIRKD